MPKCSSSVGQIESLSGRVGRPSGFASDGAGNGRRAERASLIRRVCLQVHVTPLNDECTRSYAPARMSALAQLTTLRLGGPARLLVEARTEDEAIAAVRAAAHARGPP